MCALIDIAEGVYFFIQCRECTALITIDPGYFSKFTFNINFNLSLKN